MSPYSFWWPLFSNIINFIKYLNLYVISPLFNFILNNNIILIIITFAVLGFVIRVVFEL